MLSYLIKKITEIGGESMQDVILLVSTSAIFIFGYFYGEKLDAFWKTIGMSRNML